jgi:hypothetical protein
MVALPARIAAAALIGAVVAALLIAILALSGYWGRGRSSSTPDPPSINLQASSGSAVLTAMRRSGERRYIAAWRSLLPIITARYRLGL